MWVCTIIYIYMYIITFYLILKKKNLNNMSLIVCIYYMHFIHNLFFVEYQ